MPRYRYQAYTRNGAIETGEIDAVSGSAAIASISKKGLYPFETSEVEAAKGLRWWEREVFGGTQVSQADLAVFSREMATLLTADLPLDDTLRIVQENAQTKRMRQLTRQLLDKVREGISLSKALEDADGKFPGYFVSVVRAGEASGALGRVFMELASFIERALEIRTRLHSALIYPIVLLVMAVLAIVVIVVKLIPNIAALFADRGADMPWFVAVSLQMESLVSRHWLVLILAASACAVGLLLLARRESVRRSWDGLTLRMPIVGGLHAKSEVARLCRTLSTLLRSGVPLVSALETARPVVQNRHFVEMLDRAIERIREGGSLRDAMGDTRFLPEFSARLIAIGEETGRLEDMFSHIARIFEAQVQTRVDRLLTLFTPAITLIIGLGVGGLIMSVMNAILSVNELALQ